MLVPFLAVGVGLDLDPWDWFWIGLWGPRVAIGLVLNWFWIGFGRAGGTTGLDTL